MIMLKPGVFAQVSYQYYCGNNLGYKLWGWMIITYHCCLKACCEMSDFREHNNCIYSDK